MRAPASLRSVELPVGACTSAVLVLTFVFARTGIPGWIPPAIMVRAGVPSPFSGMTRSVVALARGDVASAFAWHPLGPFAFVALALAAAVSWYSLARGRRPERVARILGSRGVWAGVVAVVLLTWVRQILVLDV